MNDRATGSALALLATGLGLALGARIRRRRRFSFRGKSVVITGGSRGLGLVLARQLGRQGARISLLARDASELVRAAQQVSSANGEVVGIPCDLRKQEAVQEAIHKAAARHGGIDVLINNAGIIQVGPVQHMRIEDFQEALAIHLYAPLYTTLAALPHLRRSRAGRIVNIASIGGKIAVPHLLPYCASKFALVGLSEGLRAELKQEGILVTTICPGLMRTGSPRNAFFKGRHRREYAWFAVSGSLPVLSMSAERAARKIISACRRGQARLVIGLDAKCAVLLNDLFPGAVAALMAAANQLLPSTAPGARPHSHPGHQSESPLAPSWLTSLSERAARQNNELAAEA